MSGLSGFFILGFYALSFLLPSLAVGLGVWLTGFGDPAQKTRRRLLVLLISAAASLVCLELLIWFNPYGREINSSLPAFGMLPVLIATLSLIVENRREVAGLCSTDRVLLLGMIVIFPIAFVFLWLAEHIIFYIVLGLAALLSVARLVSTRFSIILQVVISLVCVGCVILGGTGAFFTLSLESPPWLQEGLPVAAGFALLASLFLAAAILYASLRGEMVLNWRQFGFQLVLVVFLLSGSSYLVYWDGIWSSAHQRAFEDHLPFTQFLFSLTAGVLLALSLRGRRRLAGIGYVILATTLMVIALVWGWRVSAFDLTELRAAEVNQAILRYYQDIGKYPADLDELTPGYQLYLPPPVVVRQGGWCYQGGADYYRLGYVSGRFTYFKSEFHVQVYAQAGELPEKSWACDELVEKFQAGELAY